LNDQNNATAKSVKKPLYAQKNTATHCDNYTVNYSLTVNRGFSKLGTLTFIRLFPNKQIAIKLLTVGVYS